MHTKHPNRIECMKIMQIYGTPENVIKHCNAVADASCQIAFALNNKGIYLNTALVLSASLLHDIARVSEEHWNVGADYVSKIGYFKEAEIIRLHMHHSHDTDPYKLKEIDMVCLGDRLIMEDKYVGLDERMDYAIRKAEGVKWIEDIINEKREINRILIKNIENILETSLEELILNEF